MPPKMKKQLTNHRNKNKMDPKMDPKWILILQNKPNLAENKTGKSYHLPPPLNKDKGGLEPQSKA